jgi:hypothetical protein
MRYLLIIVTFLFTACAGKPDPNYLGYVEKLPKGEYVIYNYGSRHIVRCERTDGKYYSLNDGNFSKNGIPGYDAHQYRNKTKVIIK